MAVKKVGLVLNQAVEATLVHQALKAKVTVVLKTGLALRQKVQAVMAQQKVIQQAQKELLQVVLKAQTHMEVKTAGLQVQKEKLKIM